MSMTEISGISITITGSAMVLANDILSKVKADETTAILVTFVNPHCYWVARKASYYKDDLKNFNYVCCDGVGMVFITSLAGYRSIVRISFDSTSLAAPVFDRCVREGFPVFLVGGAGKVAQKAASILVSQYPGLNIVGTRSGYFENSRSVYKEIVDSGARVVVCGMGAPKQEEFLIGLRFYGWHGAGFTCGGYLDQLGKGYHYYPIWINRLNIRFLYRLWKEPIRLWRRYLVEYLYFWWALIKVASSRICRLIA